MEPDALKPVQLTNLCAGVIHISLAPEERVPEAILREAVALARAIDLNVVYEDLFRVNTPKVATLMGEGHKERLKDIILDQKIRLMIVDVTLSPIQQRNLEKAWNCKVIDRTGLILEIFGARAQTFEGRLQVELASLQYQRSRLVRAWTHLERQRGGFGFTGGPGEKQIELDRRLIDTRILRIKEDLRQTRRTRHLQRANRRKNNIPIVALVGYTNAGKSTLFNHLTKSDVLEKDQLFATLDPTIRPFKLPSGQKILLSDTVGFVSRLPTQLVEAFKATLEEVLEADLIIHVRDFHHPETNEQKADVLKVLQDLGIASQDKIIEVLNKCDLVDSFPKEQIALSAKTGEGMDHLFHRIQKNLMGDKKIKEILLPYSETETLAQYYRQGVIQERIDTKEGICLKIYC